MANGVTDIFTERDGLERLPRQNVESISAFSDGLRAFGSIRGSGTGAGHSVIEASRLYSKVAGPGGGGSALTLVVRSA
jgi:hypothetical protein